MLIQNGFANRKSNIIEQALKLFWCSTLAILAPIGCDWNNKPGIERTLQKDETPFSIPIIPESAKQESGQRNKSIRTVALDIIVTGFIQDSGSCRVAIYLGQSHFNDPEYAIAKESIAIRDSRASWQVKVSIPEESSHELESTTRLAVSAYHDENDNSRLDKSSFGIPTELYGFSKNPKRGFGPPKFGEAAIDLEWTKQPSDSIITLEVPIQIK